MANYFHLKFSKADREKWYKLLIKRNKYIQYEYSKKSKGLKNRTRNKMLKALLLNLKYLFVPWFIRPLVFRKITRDLKRGLLQNEVTWRQPVHLYVKEFLNYDIISFDVFDTLILRPLTKPTRLFTLLGIKHKMLNFSAIRINAEARARFIANEKTGSREVTLMDIYREVSLYTGIDADYGVKIEFETELEICFANSYMKTVFDILKNAGKRLIAVTDMYMTREMISELLKRCGYEGFEEIFVSSEYKCSKRNKELYKVIDEKLVKGSKIIHIGDNNFVDYLNAQECGWNAKHYKNVHSIGKYYRPKDMSPLIGSAYSGLVNTYLNNGILRGTECEDQRYRYGFIYGGLFVLGFVEWIHDFALKNKIDKILFIARDGYIVKKVYDMLFSDVKCEYLLWSRNAALRAAHKINRYEFMRQFISRRIKSNPDWTVRQAFESAGLEFLLPELKIDTESRLNTPDIEKFLLNFVNKSWSEIHNYFEKYTRAAKAYIYPMVEGCKNVCTVDTGWRGTGPMALKYLIEEEWKTPCNVTGLMAATFRSKPDANSGQLSDGSLSTYLFSPLHNTDLEAFHRNRALIYNTCVELFTTAPHPSLSKIELEGDNDYRFVFDRPEVQNYKTINKIHQGIIDFVKEYATRFKNYPQLFNISGSDAYSPIKHVMKDENFGYVLETFRHYAYNRYVGGLEDNKDIQTFEQMVEEYDMEN